MHAWLRYRYLSSPRVRLMLLVLLAVIPALGFIFHTGVVQQPSAAIEAQENLLQFYPACETHNFAIAFAEIDRLLRQNLIGLGGATMLALSVACRGDSSPTRKAKSLVQTTRQLQASERLHQTRLPSCCEALTPFII